MNRKYRKTVIAGNWKMNKLASEAKPFVEELRAANRSLGEHSQASVISSSRP